MDFDSFVVSANVKTVVEMDLRRPFSRVTFELNATIGIPPKSRLPRQWPQQGWKQEWSWWVFESAKESEA